MESRNYFCCLVSTFNMGWLKRNLFFAVGGLVAVLLLLAAAFYDWRSWDHNATAFDQLNEIYGKLKELGEKKPAPGNSKVDNIKTAKEQEAEVRAWIVQAGDFFKPIAPIPDAPEVTSEAFAAELRRTIDQLQHAAESGSVQLPPKYGFSFEAQRSIVRFAPGSLAPLAVQLGEVKQISDILFAARVNALDGIQRVRVSDDDIAGPQTDYLNDACVTNSLAVLTPYAVTFRSFSPELASVLTGFAASSYGLIVKAVNIAPAGAATQTAGAPSPYYQQGGPGAPPAPLAAGTGRGGLPTVLQEQLLRITLEVVIVKPLPKT
jgi:hypothetical protein